MTTTPTVTTPRQRARATAIGLAGHTSEDRSAGQLPAVRHGRRPGADRDPVPGLDRRDPAQAAQRHQHRPAERLHPDPGHRDGHRHHLRPHRPVGRLDRRVHRSHVRGPDDPSRHAMAGRRRGVPAAGCADRCVAGLLDRLRRHSVVHRDAGGDAGVPRRDPVPAGGAVDRAVPPQLRAGQQRIPARDRAAAASTTGPPSSSVSLVMVAAVWQQVRQRTTQTRYGFDVLAAGLVRRQVRRDRRRTRRLSLCCWPATAACPSSASSLRWRSSSTPS